MNVPPAERSKDLPVSPLTGVRTAGHLKLFSVDRVPVLQNRVYRSAHEALDAACGRLQIRFETQSQFAWNAAFEPLLMQYDQEYDNCVPSDRFHRYYDDLGDHLVEAYGLREGMVVDIGCGNGIFLSRWLGRMKQLRGLGVDPAYRGPASTCSGRLRFITDTFRVDQMRTRPDLILCRHLLEHVARPVEFLQAVTAASQAHAGLPLFVEVPDLDWILENRAYWDFCYEHCNYFTASSLAFCMEKAGARVISVSRAFGGQYLWAQAVLDPSGTGCAAAEQPAEGAARRRLMESFGAAVEGARRLTLKRLGELPIGRKIVVWGMATKGVLYTLHLLDAGLKVDLCVDINAGKQRRHAPVSGYEIMAPEQLEPASRYSIICMNPNYAGEIACLCTRLGLDVRIYSPEMERLRQAPGSP